MSKNTQMQFILRRVRLLIIILSGITKQSAPSTTPQEDELNGKDAHNLLNNGGFVKVVNVMVDLGVI